MLPTREAVAVALRLAARPEGITGPELETATGYTTRGAREILASLYRAHHLTRQSPGRPAPGARRSSFSYHLAALDK